MSESSPQPYPNSIMLTCRDMHATVDFYCGKLGFTMKEAWPDQENPRWANLVLHRQSIMIGAAEEPDEAACAHDPEGAAIMKVAMAEYEASTPGAGVFFYLEVPDVDAFHAEATARGVEALHPPKDQFYGLRDFALRDPDGYRFQIYTSIRMDSCQSCGMPMPGAEPGVMYCDYCTDETGQLRSYEQVFEGTVTGYFMGMQKMARAEAEAAAREHLGKMPAWAMRGA